MQRILVPLDGSALAEAALPQATDLASRLSGSIFLVRAVPLARQRATAILAGSGGMEAMSTVDVAAIDEALELQTQEARTYLEEEAGALKEKGIAVEWEVRQGVPADEIIACAQENNIDLIAISSHGRSGIGRLVFGSVCDRVMREAGIPVLVIKPGSDQDAGDGGA